MKILPPLSWRLAPPLEVHMCVVYVCSAQLFYTALYDDSSRRERVRGKKLSISHSLCCTGASAGIISNTVWVRQYEKFKKRRIYVQLYIINYYIKYK
jgi:hypothetical protein